MLRIKFYYYSVWLCCFVFLQTTIFSQTQISQTDLKVSQPAVKSADLIHFGDLIDVDVVGSTEFDWRGTLNPEGYLNGVDFVEEPIYALCRSEEEVAKDIVNGYKKLLRNPQVVVKVIDRSGRAVSYLYGAVKIPQRFQIQRPARLNELIIMSGGMDEKASGEIQILRSSRLNCENSKDDKENKNEIESEILKIKISDLIKGKKEANPFILNGDIITVTEAAPIYIIGGVANPRQINTSVQMTVSRAIASAGGFTKNADLKNIVVFRRNKNETTRIEVDFNKITAKQSEDVVLQKYDIVEIAQKGAEKRKFAPIVKVFEKNSKTLEMPLRVIE